MTHSSPTRRSSDRKALPMPILDATPPAQLKSYLVNLRRPIELVASLDASAKSAEMRALVEEVAAQSDLVTARFDGDDARRPSFAIRGAERRAATVFAGLPMGHEFTSLILALLPVGGHPPQQDPKLLAPVPSLPGEIPIPTDT